MSDSKKILSGLSALAASLFLAIGPGCGGTGTGNPSLGVALTSKPYYSAVSSAAPLSWVVPSAYAAGGPVNRFLFCVTQLKIESFDGSPVGEGTYENRLGLVDLRDGTQTVTWGHVSLARGTPIRRIKIEVHRDPQSCGGADYSASVNGQTITKDLEFKFLFSQDRALNAGDTVSIALDTLVTKLEQAIQANQFNDQDISNYLDGSFEDSAD